VSASPWNIAIFDVDGVEVRIATRKPDIITEVYLDGHRFYVQLGKDDDAQERPDPVEEEGEPAAPEGGEQDQQGHDPDGVHTGDVHAAASEGSDGDDGGRHRQIDDGQSVLNTPVGQPWKAEGVSKVTWLRRQRRLARQ
jgi:hypothetical protein